MSRIIGDWTDEDRDQWLTLGPEIEAVYAAWVDKAGDAFAHDPTLRERLTGTHDAAWFRAHLEQYLPVFRSSPDAPAMRDASRRVGFAHIQSHVLPSSYVGLYNLMFDAYHSLEASVPDLPALRLVRRRWLADVKTVLDTYEVAVSGKIAALNDLALTDPLTGLTNRRGFWKRVAYDIDHGIHEAIFVVIDIDHFKAFNDANGHPAGDLLLQTFAALSQQYVGSGDILARLGGDEFAWWSVDSTDLDALSDRLASLATALKSHRPVTFSVGAAQFPRDGADIEPLYGAADMALYRAKNGGRNRFAVAGRNTLQTWSAH